MALDRVVAATTSDLRGARMQLLDELLHPSAASGEEFRIALDLGRQDSHASSLSMGSDRTVRT
jgi:hypothetical protein